MANKSERKLMEELKTSRNEVEDFLYYLPDAYVEIDIDPPRLAYMNRNALILFGFTQEDFERGIEFAQLVDKDQSERMKEIVMHYVSESREKGMPYHRSGKQELYEFKMKRKDGSYFYGETQTSFKLDENDIPVGLRVIIRDMTERREMENKVKERETQYRLLFENSGMSISIHDPEGTFLMANPIVCSQQGTTIENIVGKPLHDFFSPEKAELYTERIRRIARSGKGEVIEDLVELPGGRRWFLAIMEPAQNQEGETYGVQIAAHDITELRQAQEGLRMMTEQMPAVLWTIDKELRFTSSTGKGLSALGLTTGQVVGMKLYEYFQTDGPNALPIAAHIQAMAGHPTNFEIRWEDHTYEAHVEPLRGPDGEVIGAIGVGLDITARKTAEERLQRSRQQLRHLTRHQENIREQERTRISREIHDQLGQTLTGLKMDLALIKDEVDPDERHHRITNMSKLIDEAIQTVRKLASDLRPGVLDDLGLSAAIEWQAQDFSMRTGVACSVVSRPNDITADPERSTTIFRIFQEALTNIARHAEASEVEVLLANEGGRLLLRVTDNGKGINEEQIHNPKSLGLLGIHERVQAWGGGVEIVGSSANGTTLLAWIPAAGTN